MAARCWQFAATFLVVIFLPKEWYHILNTLSFFLRVSQKTKLPFLHLKGAVLLVCWNSTGGWDSVHLLSKLMRSKARDHFNVYTTLRLRSSHIVFFLIRKSKLWNWTVFKYRYETDANL